MGDNCCRSTNIAACQHYDRIEAGPDLQIAYFQNAHIPTCKGTLFEGDPNCGTFIEIHRVVRPRETVSVRMSTADSRRVRHYPLADAVPILADVRIDDPAFVAGYLTTR